MAKISNEKVAMAFDTISKNEDYPSTLANALSLLAHVVDAAERIVPTKGKRVEVNIGIDSLSKGYHIVCEEIGGEHEAKN
jgi:hypothetical protein